MQLNPRTMAEGDRPGVEHHNPVACTGPEIKAGHLIVGVASRDQNIHAGRELGIAAIIAPQDSRVGFHESVDRAALGAMKPSRLACAPPPAERL